MSKRSEVHCFGNLSSETWAAIFGSTEPTDASLKSPESKNVIVKDKKTNFKHVPPKRPQKVTLSMARFLGRPEFLLFPDSAHQNSPGTKTIMKFDNLIGKVAEILKNGSPYPYGKDLASLEKLTLGFENLVKTPGKLKKIQKIQKEHRLLFYEQEFLATAKWFMHFDEFRELPLEVQLEIVKASWMVWGRLQKLARTAEFRKRKILENEKMFMICDDVYLDAESVQIDVSWLTKLSQQEVSYFLNCYQNEPLNQVIKELITLRPTNTEINFMLMNLCLQQANKKLESYQDIIDYLQSVIANQIHKYYVKEWKMPNYSGRLSKMMKVNNLMKRDTWETFERMRIAEIFDVFTIDFSHCEMKW